MAYNSRSIQVFLWLVSAIYLCAFTSLFCQIPGLYGENGIYPAAFVLEDKSSCNDKDRRCHMWSESNQCKLNAEWMLENCAKSCNSCRAGIEHFLHFPTLLWFTPHLGLTCQTGMMFLCAVGILLSFVMLLSGPARDCINFLILWVLYFSLVQVGQVFLYYQWDTLLLEAGFLAFFVAPWDLYIGLWNIWKCKRVQILPKEHDTICFWLVKWLLFRLMFASGIVKLLWMDKTWWNLTALNWHYESQCIPNAFSWYMQKLPVPFHRLSVVLTYLIEIVVPFFFFVPFRAVKIFAFSAQMLLQLMILSTGNYNFFNLLTISLCFSLLQDKDLECKQQWLAICRFAKDKCTKKSKKQQTCESRGQDNLQLSNDKKVCNFYQNAQEHHFDSLRGMAMAWQWIKRKFPSKKMMVVEDFAGSRHFEIMKKVLLAVVFACFMLILIDIASEYFGVRLDKREFIHSQIDFNGSQFLRALPVMIYVAIVIGIVSLSLETIFAAGRCFLKSYELSVKLVALAQCIVFGFLAFWIFGLTLVPFTELDAKPYQRVPAIFHKQHKLIETFKIFNAYGLFRSMTGIGGRPEVIIMGANSLDRNASWQEYNFQYKPGNIYTSPTCNVPHQPRLDWQMWFAALEDYRSNPWFINLSYKLLIGEPSVLNLMAENPFKSKPPKYIRSFLYRYHYTLNHTGFGNALFKSSSEKRWWSREYVAEYMPAVSKNDTVLIKLLTSFGLKRIGRKKEHHWGFLHSFLVFMSTKNQFFRTEFLIYLKFVALLFIVAFQHWWNGHGLHKIKPKIRRMDEAIKVKMAGISSKIRQS